MKLPLVGLIAFTFTLASCGGKSSSGKREPTPVPPNESNAEGVAVVEENEIAPEPVASQSPAVGVYLGSCETLGSIGVASGVEITATAILPVTAIFGDKLCAEDSLATFGYTGSFESFSTYASFINSQSSAAGDPVTASFIDTLITFASASGHKVSLIKRNVTLFTAKRLIMTLFGEVVNSEAKTVSANVMIKNSIFATSQWELAFYCEKDGKLVRQESTFTHSEAGTKLEAKLNTWPLNNVTFPTRCQAAFTLLHGENGQEKTDIAYSQFLNVL